MKEIGIYYRYFLDLIKGHRSGGELAAARKRESDCAPYLPSRKLMVLDLANGRLRPQTLILSAQGHKVVGLDRVNEPKLSLKNIAYWLARGIFSWKLGIPYKLPLQLVSADACHFPFRNDCFDLVSSIAAFEHFLDVPKVVSEVHRVLRPGGVAWVSIHVFTTISGGHNVNLGLLPIDALPKGVKAWDHLQERKLPFNVPLNEWRIADYLREFSKKLDIVKHNALGSEGKAFLTEEIREKLSQYSEEELTCGAYLIVARKVK